MPPRVQVEALEAAAKRRGAALVTDSEARRGVIAAVVDPYVNGAHVSLLEMGEMNDERQQLIEQWLALGPRGIERPLLMNCLHDGAVMLMMHRAVWTRPAEHLHPGWREAVASYRMPTETGW